ncbi:MAG TPA: chemotaxis protein CheW [Xanthomonadales bacterium]|nr:chemotaxis protein CheW [Xanthomonadales bacterium]
MKQDLLDRIDQRIRLAGHNRLALLLFRLGGRQLFGVNVFKVQEVLPRPRLFAMPQAPAQVLGAADVRGRSIPVIDLGKAIRHPEANDSPGYLLVTEFNCSLQGFLVSEVDRIVNIPVEQIELPPEQEGRQSRLTAITRHQGELIQIVDVEQVLAEISNIDALPMPELDGPTPSPGSLGQVLVVDDSRVARAQIQRVLEHLGLSAVQLADGRQALEHLKRIADSGEDPAARYRMVISDIEMPAMDGYTLTTEIRRDKRLAGLYVILHTSLSGIFNNAMVQRVGADRFVAKYHPDELASRIMERLTDQTEPIGDAA